MRVLETNNSDTVKVCSLEDQKSTIISVPKSTNGNKLKAAEILRISRDTLYRKIQQYSISKDLS